MAHVISLAGPLRPYRRVRWKPISQMILAYDHSFPVNGAVISLADASLMAALTSRSRINIDYNKTHCEFISRVHGVKLAA